MDSQKIKNTKGDWPNIDYIIFDEISMIGCTMLANIHLKLQNLKSETQRPFGNINIMFLGDFIQFPHVTDSPLYT
jgi:hypothetical protein